MAKQSAKPPAKRTLVEFDDVVGQAAQIPAKKRQRIRIDPLGPSIDHFHERLKGMEGDMGFALRQERLDGETAKMNHPRHLVDQEERTTQKTSSCSSVRPTPKPN